MADGSGHVIDHENLTVRTWVCTKCGCTCLSKNPWSRNTHGEGTGDMTQRMWMNLLQAVSSARVVDARPPRPRETEMMYMGGTKLVDRDSPFCFIHHDKDIALYITHGNGDISDTGKPLMSDAERLLQFLGWIREVDEDTLRMYACGQFGWHDWTDDPTVIDKWSKDRKRKAKQSARKAEAGAT